jgi:2-polyprenyl-3-methyl-5-hydroxy-6-metoxy-1,4-benzoquinol methylase
VRQEDVTRLRDESVDVVCCYFLLHELPDDYKKAAMAALLDSVRPGGKVVFVTTNRTGHIHSS